MNRITEAKEKLLKDRAKVMEEAEQCGIDVTRAKKELETALEAFQECRRKLGYINGQIQGLEAIE